MSGAYDDIIALPHHVSPTHPQMPAENRAAQFAPFAALTDFGAAITETSRVTEEKLELDECEKEALNETLKLIAEHAAGPDISVTYFKPDSRKSGGAYITASGAVRKLDAYSLTLCLKDGTLIPFDDIIKLELL